MLLCSENPLFTSGIMGRFLIILKEPEGFTSPLESQLKVMRAFQPLVTDRHFVHVVATLMPRK